ncbi:hypothetical protein JMJ35_006454 [Cladonia borealis]|uniref:Uncharacterized protein n=1 Tax=Cladonia borealis TaxID=184061 RepID=A0AA39QX73_9LECA|nr:hypothetical protein JMJ35_006454 [Cladonia borealis]
MPNRSRKRNKKHVSIDHERLPADSSSLSSKRNVELQWPSICGSRQKFIDANCILSMLSPQQRDEDLEDDYAQHDFTELWDPERSEQCDQQHLSIALAQLRNRFLDRLAEVLARVKLPPEAAKQVTSAYLGEREGYECLGHVHIVLAKNEGLTAVDEPYLNTLGEILLQRARGETTFDEARQVLFSETVQYAFPRIKYYMNMLRKEFSRLVTSKIEAGNGYHSLFNSHVLETTVLVDR